MPNKVHLDDRNRISTSRRKLITFLHAYAAFTTFMLLMALGMISVYGLEQKDTTRGPLEMRKFGSDTNFMSLDRIYDVYWDELTANSTGVILKQAKTTGMREVGSITM
ncbi:hypothetical protein CLCR_09315 [Cladophialophora carrionii]|uniref:Uncharacterized protein n=1 Tax=Cladophialophora carrionii TaxID=86049 RepID=A0A1C1CTF3_9EURO|nr:hypothetical protein CLCR_09315 [Cladophialophora carrionii]